MPITFEGFSRTCFLPKTYADLLLGSIHPVVLSVAITTLTYFQALFVASGASP